MEKLRYRLDFHGKHVVSITKSTIVAAVRLVGQDLTLQKFNLRELVDEVFKRLLISYEIKNDGHVEVQFCLIHAAAILNLNSGFIPQCGQPIDVILPKLVAELIKQSCIVKVNKSYENDLDCFN